MFHCPVTCIVLPGSVSELACLLKDTKFSSEFLLQVSDIILVFMEAAS